MKTSVLLALALGGAQAFQASAPAKSGTKLHAYVPSGMRRRKTRNRKKREAVAKKKKNRRGGARGFESRSTIFMRAQGRGEAEHLFPWTRRRRTGEIPLKDVPYMQRGGS